MEEYLISKEQFKKAINIFIEKTYTPKVPQTEYILYFGKIGYMHIMLNKHWNSIADGNNMVDINEFYNQYSKMFEHVSEVDVYGFSLNKNDLNELMGYIKAQAPKGVVKTNDNA